MNEPNKNIWRLPMTKDEEKLFKLFKAKEQLSIDDVRIALAARSNSAATVRLKYLTAKVAPDGWIIKRVSGIGRSVKGVYEMRKMF